MRNHPKRSAVPPRVPHEAAGERLPAMTKINLTELERLAGEAELGPGEVEEDRKPWAYAAFLEAADPTTILALCKALREAEKALENAAKQALPNEMYEPRYADYEYGYSEMVRDARKALTSIWGKVEGL
jgi:hypothetical protein